MSSTITNVAGHICLMRQQICPKTSYATSGSAAKLLYVFENKQIARSSCQVPIVNEIQNMLTLNSGSSVGPLKSEFESSEIFDLDNFSPAAGNINGHVIVFLNTCKDDSHSLDNGISGSLDLLARKRSKLVIYISVESSDTMLPVAKKNSLETMISKKLSDERYRNITSNCYSINVEDSTGKNSLTIEMRSLHVATANLDRRSISDSSLVNMRGFNKQPAVCSRTQFKYLKQINSDGWQRVLQRLADKELFGEKGSKYSTVQWNDIISKMLLDPHLNDYAIYSAIRRFVLGSSLDTDLQISSSHHNSSTSHSVPAPDTKVSESSGGGGGGGDGRASHMVAMTVENIPPHLYPPNASGPKSSQLSSSSPFPIKLLLDYGCAEGSITAELGRQLRLTPQQVIGADVRVIASDGFTFMPLPAEEEATGLSRTSVCGLYHLVTTMIMTFVDATLSLCFELFAKCKIILPSQTLYTD